MGGMRWVTKAKCACTSACVDTEYVCVRMDRTLPVPDPPPTRDGPCSRHMRRVPLPPPQTSPGAKWTTLRAGEGTPLTLPSREMRLFSVSPPPPGYPPRPPGPITLQCCRQAADLQEKSCSSRQARPRTTERGRWRSRGARGELQGPQGGRTAADGSSTSARRSSARARRLERVKIYKEPAQIHALGRGGALF